MDESLPAGPLAVVQALTLPPPTSTDAVSPRSHKTVSLTFVAGKRGGNRAARSLTVVRAGAV